MRSTYTSRLLGAALAITADGQLSAWWQTASTMII
jgi:hypothetical protein